MSTQREGGLSAGVRRGRRWYARVDVWIPLFYVSLSSVWIVASDLALSAVFARGGGGGWSIAKGLGFVAVTAVALHLGLRRALADERAAYLALSASDERKGQFIAMLSHELRNPLAPLRHALWLLDRAPPRSQQATHARQILGRQVLHLTRLTDDLLDATRVSRGKICLQRARVDLVAAVRQSIEDHRALFDARQIALEARLPVLPLWADADRTRIGQVLGNALWNAAKFSDPGSRTHVSIVPETDGTAAIRVRDEGIGIPAEILPHVFEPFVQADRSLDRTRGGLGLGLALVKSLVELHGGRVDLRSDGPGRGAELTVRIPLAPEQPVLATPVAAAREAMPRHRVLVVEDNPDAADTLREMLQLWDHEVEVAHDGRGGVERARSFRPDVVLCDIGLPGMDGYAVARAIRADPELASAYLVAVTGYASTEDARRAAGAGFDLHLGKPVPIEVLEEVLATAPRAGARAAVH
jgi:signal transduction histidine kinase/CheY-like chemotaxis protein